MLPLQINKQDKASLRQNSFVQVFLLREGVQLIHQLFFPTFSLQVYISYYSGNQVLLPIGLVDISMAKKQALLSALDFDHDFVCLNDLGWHFFLPEHVTLL